MIISASRRTDIPSFYSNWFFKRIGEGYVLVPNPFNPKQISRIALHPEVVDCIVFWTKNPAPMIRQLDRLKEYSYYFQFTLNPYGKEIETHLPPLKERMEIFKQLAEKTGKEKVIWRYDPVLINKKYDISFHREAFARIADELKDHTRKCMLGFIDHYRHIHQATKQWDIRPLALKDIEEMALSFRETANQYGFALNTCTIKTDLQHLGIQAGSCIDKQLIEQITGYPVAAGKDKNQREVCLCIESIDIGSYDSCLNGCIYCYAIKGKQERIIANRKKHDPDAPLLIGELPPDAIIKDRKMKSLRDNQFSLF